MRSARREASNFKIGFGCPDRPKNPACTQSTKLLYWKTLVERKSRQSMSGDLQSDDQRFELEWD